MATPSRSTLSHVLAAALCGALILPITAARAQDGAAKPRLELADSAHKGAASQAQAARPVPPATSSVKPAPPPATRADSPAPTPAPQPGPGRDGGQLRPDFVRNQTALGVAIYAPSFSTVIAHDGLSWSLSYLLVAGGTYVASAEVSREVRITDPMYHLSTNSSIRGAIAGSLFSAAIGGDQRATAGSMFVGSVGATAASLWWGQDMTDGEASATTFGSDVLGLSMYGFSTAGGMRDQNGHANRGRLGFTVAGMVAGAPLGQAYVALAPYNVTPGDLTAMEAAGGVGMLAGLTVIAPGKQGEGEVAGAMVVGGLVGMVFGDRYLVRRYDHTREEGRILVGGTVAGGLMGAGVSLLTGASKDRWTTSTAAMTTVGALGGLLLTQRYLVPKADGELKLGSLELNPMGIVAAATRANGSYTLGTIRF